MKQIINRFLPKLLGRNLASTPVDVISDQMRELRPLPMGRTEFEEWSDRIIAGALVPAQADSVKFALANMLTMMGATEDHKEDIFFIKSLRRSAIQQVAQDVQRELHDKAKVRLAAEESQKVAEMPKPNMTAPCTLVPK